jgi:diacylglycerol O-acyltransferase 2, plant
LYQASVIFYVPILRELLLILGCRDAGKHTIEALLQANRSIGCSPGGVWEQLHTDSKKEQCFVMSNAGFLRLALKHGRPVVPIYAFGENQLYTTYDLNPSLRKWLAREMYLGVSLCKDIYQVD